MEPEVDSIEFYGPLGLMMELCPKIGRWLAGAAVALTLAGLLIWRLKS